MATPVSSEDEPVASASRRDEAVIAVSALPPLARAFLCAFVAGGAIAYGVAGLDALAVWAGVGTALGTLGLAFFTLVLAGQTGQTVAASQRIERISLEQLQTSLDSLKAARDQALAAASSAREAQRARIDGLAPLVDLSVQFETAQGVSCGATRQAFDLAANGGSLKVPHSSVETGTFTATFAIQLRNFGLTPAHVRFTHLGISIVVAQDQVFRIEPGETGAITLEGRQSWRGFPRPDEPYPFELRAEVRGPMTSATRDEVTWKGSITLLRDFGSAEGVQLNMPRPLKQIDYQSERFYDRSDPAPIE